MPGNVLLITREDAANRLLPCTEPTLPRVWGKAYVNLRFTIIHILSAYLTNLYSVGWSAIIPAGRLLTELVKIQGSANMHQRGTNALLSSRWMRYACHGGQVMLVRQRTIMNTEKRNVNHYVLTTNFKTMHS